MAQDIITLTLCDVCLEHDDERHDAKPFQLPTPDGLADIDLCEVHAKPYRDALAELLTYARMPKRRASRGGDVICPLCGKGLKDQPGVARHMTRVHPEATEERAAFVGQPQPEPDGSVTCPECGRGFGRPQGLAVHRFRTHGVRKPEPSQPESDGA